jgi:hypothetical protein
MWGVTLCTVLLSTHENSFDFGVVDSGESQNIRCLRPVTDVLWYGAEVLLCLVRVS